MNLYQSYPLEYQRWGPAYDFNYLYFRVATQAQKIEDKLPTYFVFVTDGSWSPEGLKKLQWVYGIPSSSTQLNNLVVDGPAFPDTSQSLLADSKSLIIMHPHVNPDWQNGLAPELQNLGKTACDIKTNAGETRFQLWYSPGDLRQLCK